MSIVLWGQEVYREHLEYIRRGLLTLQKQKLFDETDIRIRTGPFEICCCGKDFAEAELIFVYFSTAGEDFCRFLITHRRYTEKTVFLFGQSYGCFDSEKISNYYRVPEEEYICLSGKKDYFYESGLKSLLGLIRRRRCRAVFAC